jgi:hypothetical protein
VNHLAVAPGGKAFACAAGRLVNIFTLGDGAQQAPAQLVLGPLDSTVRARTATRHLPSGCQRSEPPPGIPSRAMVPS